MATKQVWPVATPPVHAVTTYVDATPSAAKVTVAEPLPATAIGAEREDAGLIELEAREPVDAVLLPLGVTVNVYDVPLVSPVTVQFVDAAGIAVVPPAPTVQVWPLAVVPMYAVTTYVDATPSGIKVTLIAPLPLFKTVGIAMGVKVVIDADVEALEPSVPPLGVTENV